ncbi:MAG TPA: hypothetical protein VE913_09620 [Longimicrobium sp.]|nr:hypothetical protein [Longimicrobium sp.]
MSCEQNKGKGPMQWMMRRIATLALFVSAGCARGAPLDPDIEDIAGTYELAYVENTNPTGFGPGGATLYDGTLTLRPDGSFTRSSLVVTGTASDTTEERGRFTVEGEAVLLTVIVEARNASWTYEATREPGGLRHPGAGGIWHYLRSVAPKTWH